MFLLIIFVVEAAVLCLDGVWSVPVRVVQGREAEVMQ